MGDLAERWNRGKNEAKTREKRKREGGEIRKFPRRGKT